MINIVVKSPSTYPGASDLNAPGYDTSLDATYATFCNSNGSALYSDGFTSITGSAGSYVVTGDSATTACVTGCNCRIAIDAVGYFYATFISFGTGNELNITYLLTGDASALSEAAVDAAVGGAVTGDIVVGGALADPVFAALLQLAGDKVLIESLSSSRSTYTITAPILINELSPSLFGVDENGEVISIKNKNLRPVIKPGANLSYLIGRTSTTSTKIVLESIELDGDKDGTYTAQDDFYCIQSFNNRFFNVDFNNCTRNGLRLAQSLPSYSQSDYFAAFCTISGNGSHGLFVDNYGRGTGDWRGCVFDDNGGSGVFSAGSGGFGVFIGCQITNNAEYGFSSTISTNRHIESCVLAGNSSGDVDKARSSLTRIVNSIGTSGGTTVVDSGAVISLHNSYWTGSFSGAGEVETVMEIADEPPFIGGSGDDRYMLDSSHVNFASYYNNDTGEIYAGAYGPKVTAGGVGGVSRSRVFGGL